MNTPSLASLAPAPRQVDLATYLQQMREQERGELARELHDELGALLTCAKLDVASLKSRLAGSTREVDQRLQHLSDMINSGIAFSQRVVEGLHPSSLANLGLGASLDILAREFAKSTGIRVAVEAEPVELGETQGLAIYRVVQESLNNTSKYAAARSARIAVRDRGSDIEVTVQDDGKGFDTAAPGTASHGVAGMRHRVESCGGRFSLVSAPGRGTRVTALFPKPGS
jgi:signal transduction histidine kinase